MPDPPLKLNNEFYYFNKYLEIYIYLPAIKPILLTCLIFGGVFLSMLISNKPFKSGYK